MYGQLVAEGWLEARTGSGTWVSERPGRVITGRPAAATAAAHLDLRGGIPDTGSFPRTDWAAAVRRAVSTAPAASLGYSDPQGSPRLRATLAEYLARARGAWASPASVFVARGFGDLLALACRALHAGGAGRIAVEEYGHDAHRRIITAAGLTIVPIPVDGDGAVIAALETAGVDAVLLTPAHQFPTGVPLAAARRREVVSWAERTGGLIIEDDYDGEFRFDRRNIGALQALAPDHVLYAGTASKSLAPAVGLAWAVAPLRMLPGLIEQRIHSGATADILSQLALAELVDSHRYDRHLRRLRATYRMRRETLETTFASLLPECRITGLAAGLHCLLELPPGGDEARVATEAARLDLRLEGLASYLPAGRTSTRAAAMVIGYGAPRSHTYDAAITAAARGVRAALG